MDEEGHSHGKKKLSTTVWAGVVLIIIGIMVGVYLSPYLDPILNPNRATLVENGQTLKSQNQLLKDQVDCLVNGINQNHGKTTVTECT